MCMQPSAAALPFALSVVILFAQSPNDVTSAKAVGAGSEQAKSDAVQQVLVADEARRVAMLHGDVNALESLLADDATIFWGDGSADDKSATLALFRFGRLRYELLEYEGTRIRVYGETAVVTGQARIKGQSDNTAMAHRVRLMRVYVRQQGRWRMVASQTTRIPTASSESARNQETKSGTVPS